MNRITDDVGYSLPIIEALTPHDIFVSGANLPLLVTGVDANGVKDNYVVKFRAASRMSDEACMREVLALFIAGELEIRSVDPAIINISPNFVELLKGSDIWQIASKSIGYNFGSKYIKGFKTILVTEELNPTQLPNAQKIFMYDVFVQNSDRRVDKPNLLTDGQDISILDHELAFGFVLDLFKNSTPWRLRDTDMKWINLHCLLSKFKGKDFDFDVFASKFARLDDKFWGRAWNLLPVQWRLDQFEQIRQYLSSIIANLGVFIAELKKLMS